MRFEEIFLAFVLQTLEKAEAILGNESDLAFELMSTKYTDLSIERTYLRHSSSSPRTVTLTINEDILEVKAEVQYPIKSPPKKSTPIHCNEIDEEELKILLTSVVRWALLGYLPAERLTG